MSTNRLSAAASAPPVPTTWRPLRPVEALVAVLLDVLLVALPPVIVHLALGWTVLAFLLGAQTVVLLILVEGRSGRTPGLLAVSGIASEPDRRTAPGLGRAAARTALVLLLPLRRRIPTGPDGRSGGPGTTTSLLDQLTGTVTVTSRPGPDDSAPDPAASAQAPPWTTMPQAGPHIEDSSRENDFSRGSGLRAGDPGQSLQSAQTQSPTREPESLNQPQQPAALLARGDQQPPGPAGGAVGPGSPSSPLSASAASAIVPGTATAPAMLVPPGPPDQQAPGPQAPAPMPPARLAPPSSPAQPAPAPVPPARPVAPSSPAQPQVPGGAAQQPVPAAAAPPMQSTAPPAIPPAPAVLGQPAPASPTPSASQAPPLQVPAAGPPAAQPPAGPGIPRHQPAPASVAPAPTPTPQPSPAPSAPSHPAAPQYQPARYQQAGGPAVAPRPAIPPAIPPAAPPARATQQPAAPLSPAQAAVPHNQSAPAVPADTSVPPTAAPSAPPTATPSVPPAAPPAVPPAAPPAVPPPSPAARTQSVPAPLAPSPTRPPQPSPAPAQQGRSPAASAGSSSPASGTTGPEGAPRTRSRRRRATSHRAPVLPDTLERR